MASAYLDFIKKVTTCTDDEAVVIEDIMRHDIFHSTLDWQTEKQLKKAAKMGYEIMKEQVNGNV